MNEWLKYPEEDGWHFVRWNWWSKDSTECVNVYTDENGHMWVERLSIADMKIDNLPKESLWLKIELPNIGETENEKNN